MNLPQLGSVQFWARWVEIVILNLTLSGDNALVIALAVRKLPVRQQWQGRLWGTVGAVVLRIAFVAAVSVVLRLPLLLAAGGVVLLWIALKLLAQEASDPSDGARRHGATLLDAVWMIIVADVIMSLDNVLAISGAAHGDMVLVTFGVGLSIPLVIWGSGLLARLMVRLSWIVDLGAAILGWVAGEMILQDDVVRGWVGEAAGPALHRAVQAVLAVAVVVGGRLWARRRPIHVEAHPAEE